MKNKELAIRLIQEDCKIRCGYSDYEGNTCGIGCLAKAAGAALPDWSSSLNVVPIGNTDIGEIVAMQKAIEEKFGLGVVAQKRIQLLNDQYSDQELRREAIIAYLKYL